MDLARLSRQVLYNCDVSDARHAGIYSICGLAMRLRDLYKWERGLAPWQEDEAARVLEWIGAKEELWETLLEADFGCLPINGRSYKPFDTLPINAALAPFNLFYGAGYAYSLKPTFFLAEVVHMQCVSGHQVRFLGRELARDLLTLPAFGQDGEVVIREQAVRMFLWDQIAYISSSGRRALDFALRACGLPDTHTGTIKRHFETLARVQRQIILDHEIGELEETVFPRDTWQGMLADYPHTAVELLVRTLKDLLADTSPQGTLARLVGRRDEAALGLYLAFGSGMARLMTGELVSAFDAFCKDRRWDRIAEAVQRVRQAAVAYTRRVIAIHDEGRSRKEAAQNRQAIEAFMRQNGWLPG